MKPTFEIILTTVLFAAVCFVYRGQPRISFNNGQGWDGTSYYKITEQIKEGKNPVTGQLPFIRRIGSHFLMGNYSRMTGTDLLTAALHINLLATFVTTLLLMFWLRLYIDVFWIRAVLLLLFMTSWIAPLRFAFFYPMTTDACGGAWFVGGLLLLYRIRKAYNNSQSVRWPLLAFSLVAGAGYLFRESNALLALAPVCLGNPLKHVSLRSPLRSLRQIGAAYRGKVSLLFLPPVIFLCGVHLLVSGYTVIIPSGYSYTRILAHWFYYKPIVEYTLGLCIAYGPLFLLLPFFYKHYKHVLMEQQELLFLFLFAFIFGWGGGSDTERITYMSGFPIVLILTGLSIKSIFHSGQRWWLYVLFLLQTIAYRLYWFLPDYPTEASAWPLPFFTFIGTDFQYLFLYSRHGDYLLNYFLFSEYLALFILTFFVLRDRPKSAQGY